MTGLAITGSILLLTAFLLFCSVSVEAAFEEELSARIGYLFFHFSVWPRPEKQRKEKEPEKEKQPTEKKKPSKIRELLHQKGLSGFLELLRAFSRVAYGSAKKLLSHTVVRLLMLDLTVGGEDAAQTAVNYGMACGLVSTALTGLLSSAKCKERNVNVLPDFQNGTGGVRFRIRLKIRLIFILSAGISALIGFVKVYIKSRKESGHPDQKEKAVL